MAPGNLGGSDLKTYFETSFQLATKLEPIWNSSPVPIKEKIPKVIFPKGALIISERLISHL